MEKLEKQTAEDKPSERIENARRFLDLLSERRLWGLCDFFGALTKVIKKINPKIEEGFNEIPGVLPLKDGEKPGINSILKTMEIELSWILQPETGFEVEEAEDRQDPKYLLEESLKESKRFGDLLLVVGILEHEGCSYLQELVNACWWASNVYSFLVSSGCIPQDFVKIYGPTIREINEEIIPLALKVGTKFSKAEIIKLVPEVENLI